MREIKQCVIAIPTKESAPKVVGVGDSSRRDVDKFAPIGLTPLLVRASRFPSCRMLRESRMQDRGPRRVNIFDLFVLEVVKAWINPACKGPKAPHNRGFGEFVIDGEIVKT